jgi:NAD(P)-dependent dehydrogenase (short-subunit alcohol dehydrogenase family)
MSVVVITGTGGMGLACARRLGSGHQLVLAEEEQPRLDAVVHGFREEGYDVYGRQLDVSSPESVEDLATFVAGCGPLATFVHTAGLSPTMASGERILAVNLRGTALLIDAFGRLAGEGSVGVFIASMAGHLWPVDPDWERSVALAATDEVIAATGLDKEVDPETAYAVSKRGAMVRVVAAARAWGLKGARIVSVSPGIIATSMGHQEMAAQPIMGEMMKGSPVPRFGTASEVAEAVAWLAGPGAAFITGTDLLIDGGVAATMRGWN